MDPRRVAVKRVVTISRLGREKQNSLGKCRKIHATGSGPSGLGMMQPERRPGKVS